MIEYPSNEVSDVTFAGDMAELKWVIKTRKNGYMWNYRWLVRGKKINSLYCLMGSNEAS